MNKLSLWKRVDKTLPVQIESGGVLYPINADFRNMLRIREMLDDPETVRAHKTNLLCKWFYDCEELPQDALMHYYEFVRSEEPAFLRRGGKKQEKQFDFNFDAPEIYASFVQQYRIDLFDIPFLHWYKFTALFSGLGADTPFIQKIQDRFRDLRGLKGKALQAARDRKEAAQIPKRLTKAEIAAKEAFEDEWGNVGM